MNHQVMGFSLIAAGITENLLSWIRNAEERGIRLKHSTSGKGRMLLICEVEE